MRILYAGSYTTALSAGAVDITIEAEYGDKVVEGKIYTAAHHGARSNNPAPCIDHNIPYIGDEGTILVSHLDLDTLGGIARADRLAIMHEDFKSFWELAAFIDTNGPHKLQNASASYEDERRLYGWWAWCADNRAPRRDPNILHDVTSDVRDSLNAIERLLEGDEVLLSAGDQFRFEEAELDRRSFMGEAYHNGELYILRKSDKFVNHLYRDGIGVIAYNTTTKAITLSFADGGGNACEMMQKAYGPLAGGHAGIAGTPRGVEFQFDDWKQIFIHN